MRAKRAPKLRAKQAKKYSVFYGGSGAAMNGSSKIWVGQPCPMPPSMLRENYALTMLLPQFKQVWDHASKSEALDKWLTSQKCPIS